MERTNRYLEVDSESECLVLETETKWTESRRMESKKTAWQLCPLSWRQVSQDVWRLVVSCGPDRNIPQHCAPPPHKSWQNQRRGYRLGLLFTTDCRVLSLYILWDFLSHFQLSFMCGTQAGFWWPASVPL
jgi:hypothetical protein